MFFRKKKKEIKITGTSTYIDVEIDKRVARIAGEMVAGGFVCYKNSMDCWLVPENVEITESEKEDIIQRVTEKTAGSHMVIRFEDISESNDAAEENKNDDALGWQSIENEFLRVYKGQTNPRHYMTLVKWRFGGNDPLDGISIYEGEDYWHFVSFGLTELYKKESDDKETSGFGYELTFKLKKYDYEDLDGELTNICGILQSIARIVFNGEVFSPDEYLYTGQTQGIDANKNSNLTGFILIKDPTVETIDTPFGKVSFLELVGMTDSELKTLSTRETVRELYKKLGSDVTDYNRKSLV